MSQARDPDIWWDRRLVGRRLVGRRLVGSTFGGINVWWDDDWWERCLVGYTSTYIVHLFKHNNRYIYSIPITFGIPRVSVPMYSHYSIFFITLPTYIPITQFILTVRLPSLYSKSLRLQMYLHLMVWGVGVQCIHVMVC